MSTLWYVCKHFVARHTSLCLSVAVFILLAWLALHFRSMHKPSSPPLLSIGIEHPDSIDLTPAQIRSIERIGQWEFLAIQDEELVDTIRHHLLGPDDHLVRIYQGTLRLGIDMSQCSGNWVQAKGDTLHVTLPPVRLLSERFIDEARTRSFHESGKWDASAREAMYHKAAHNMRSRCLTPANIKNAEDNAREQFSALFRSFDFKEVDIHFGQ